METRIEDFIIINTLELAKSLSFELDFQNELVVGKCVLTLTRDEEIIYESTDWGEMMGFLSGLRHERFGSPDTEEDNSNGD